MCARLRLRSRPRSLRARPFNIVVGAPDSIICEVRIRAGPGAQDLVRLSVGIGYRYQGLNRRSGR